MNEVYFTRIEMSPDPDAAEPLIIEAFKFRHFIVLNTEMAIRSSDGSFLFYQLQNDIPPLFKYYILSK